MDIAPNDPGCYIIREVLHCHVPLTGEIRLYLIHQSWLSTRKTGNVRIHLPCTCENYGFCKRIKMAHAKWATTIQLGFTKSYV